MMLLFLKEKITSEQSGLRSDVVPVAGLEPARPRALDFECFDHVCPPLHSAVIRPPQTIAITGFCVISLDFSIVSKMP